MAAPAGYLDDGTGWRETLRSGVSCQGGKVLRRIELRNRAAALADQKCCRHTVMCMGAGDIGIAAFDLVDEPMRQEEIERPVNGDRRRPGSVDGHPIDDLISACRRMALGNAGQYLAALRGQPRAAPAAHPLGPGDQLVRAAEV